MRRQLLVALVVGGRSRAGLTRLHEAVLATEGVDQARVRLRRANALLVLGRPTEALADLKWALMLTRRARDRLWEGRCLVHRSWAMWSLSRPKQAESDARHAERLLLAVGQHHEAGWVLNNLAYYTFYSGDLPQALTLVEAAEKRFAEVGQVPPHPAETRCR